MIDITKYN